MKMARWGSLFLLTLPTVILHSVLCFSSLSKTIKSVSVPVNAPIGYQVTKLDNYDPATSLLESLENDAHKLFHLRETGEIVTKAHLSDVVDQVIPVSIRNAGSSKPDLVLYISVDSSSHIVFPQTEYVGTLKENLPPGTNVKVVGHLTANSEILNDVKYSIESDNSHLFRLENVSYGSVHALKIVSQVSLDRETKDLHTVVIQASAGTDQTSSATIFVYVLDVNDNIPVFPYSLLKVTSRPDQLWEIIVTLQANDSDLNDKLQYHVEGSKDFIIDSNSGELFTEGEYIHPGSYHVFVYAVDSVGHKSLPVSVLIEIDGGPLMFKPESHFHHHVSKRATITTEKVYTVLENSTTTGSLFSIATIQNSNREVYGLISASVDMFQAPDQYGGVYLKPGARLDYEDVNQRNIILVFNKTNRNTPDDVTIINVQLRVQDKNDENPVFKNQPVPFLATVSTNPRMGATIYTLYADDPDSNSEIAYNLESGGEGKFLMITERDIQTGDMVGRIVTTVSGPGQFVEGREYTLVVSAQDLSGMTTPQKSDFRLVKVLVGLRPPQLFENPFIAHVDENSGTKYKILGSNNRILIVRTKCFQDTQENRVSFSLYDADGQASSLFSINNNGEIETLQNLDYEQQPNQYTLNITATELQTGLISSSLLIVNVRDVNDNSPKFPVSTYTKTVAEDLTVGSLINMLVTATDRDSEENGRLVYSVSDEHFTMVTKLDTTNNKMVGQLKIAKRLDYDYLQDHQYKFNVTAVDQGDIPRSGSATVIIYVTNANDESPVFGTGVESLYASISEEQESGSVVTLIQATDPDGDNIKYYFTPKNIVQSPFRIDPDSGLLTLTTTLPETVPFYTLNITAIDDGSCCGGAPILSSQTYIVVEIKDTNNNQPTFPSCNYEPVVLENQLIGTSVQQVEAVDNDRGGNGNITFSIVTSPLQPKLFEVDPNTGLVVTAVRFDRDSGQGKRGYSVTVKASDQGQPQPLDNHCRFWVQIGDVNDNAPVFDSPSYTTSISESVSGGGRRKIFAVRASDIDEGLNAKTEYILTENPGNFFSVEMDSGIIYLENPLVGQNQVVLRVTAKDKGTPPLSSSATVTIRITDRTNMAPTWDSSEYERDYVVKETAPIGYTIATMRASSNLVGSFDDVSFALIDSLGRSVQYLGPFRIYQSGNTVTIRTKGTLDYNVKIKYELRLRVTNQGQTPLSAEIRPVIIIQDMNNEPPQFEGLDPTLSNSYKASVPENTPSGQTVLAVLAVDSDHDPPNNVVKYSLMEDKNDAYLQFAVDETTGIVTTRSTFDRETQRVYYIKVKAEDGIASDAMFHEPPDTPNSATAQVQIIISDKNDNSPYFTQPYWNISVPEQRPDNTGRIVTLTAEDKDDADILTYSITDGNIGSVFGIRQKTGDIYVAQSLDYEKPPTRYNLTVMVRDGLFQNTSYILINVTDVNDNPPEFSMDTYEIRNVVEETVPPYPEGQFLVQVSATDMDVSRQNNFRFTLSGDGTSLSDPTFTIEPDTGRIYLRKKLDRDLPEGRSEYQFNVIAQDEPDTPNSLFGYAYVKVMPHDINDNDPVFSENELHGSVAEHSPAGQSVMTVVARDSDAGNNGTVYYEIDPYGNTPADPLTSTWYFKIDSETGLITTNLDNSLDRETTAQYFLQVIAKDKGIEHRSSTATVTINIADINDQVPQFVQKIYRVSMSENQQTGPVITVSATDNDIDENARLSYTLKPSDGTYFSIETMPPNAGVLTVFRAVDYEKVRSFNLTVYVQDNNPLHQDEAYIEIEVEDYNDNPPEFVEKVKTIRMPENIPEGTSLWNCSAYDADSGINAEFEYSIDRRTDEGRRFTVDAKGEVKIRMGLDGETLDREALTGLSQNIYEVHILAIDKGYPRQIGVATLMILVDDLNDNVPEFVLPHPPMVMEGEVPPRHVVTFSAKDRDTPKFGAPFFFKLPPCEENPSCSGEDNLDFTLIFDPNGDNGNGTGTVTAQRTFWRDKQKYHYLPIIMSDMRDQNSALAMTGTNTLTIEIGDINNHPHEPGHKDIFVYKYDFKGASEDIVIGNVYAKDPDDWDVKDKKFFFVGPPAMANYFSVDLSDGLIRMNKKTPSGIHRFTAIVWDFRVYTDKNITSTVSVTVEEITDEAIFSSGSVRFTGATAEEFVEKSAQNSKGTSPYDEFRSILAKRLAVPERNVAIFSVMNGRNNAYTDIRFAAHGSPYYPPSKLNGIVAMEKEAFEQQAGISISMVSIDMCIRETCESGGCSNILEVGDQPNYVNTNGTSFIGISTSVRAECQCRAKNFADVQNCSPGHCLNGGTCLRDEWGDISCDCPKLFDGPRCQRTRHSFNGGFALYTPLEQCEDSSTSIEFVTKNADGLLFYNGPVEELTRDTPTDFISLELRDGYPIIHLDHGSGKVVMVLDGRDVHGNVVMQKLNDGRWHHIDIIRKGKEVTMVVDRCEMTNVDTFSRMDDRRPCAVTMTTPGENFYLNVHSMLQMGGRYATPSYPEAITDVRFMGCIRNLIHNGQLYDLNTGREWFTLTLSEGDHPFKNNYKYHQNDCPDEDLVCGINSIDGPRCGEHGICEMTDMINQQYKCTCKPAYRPSSSTSNVCDTETTIRDMQVNSFMSWSLKPNFFSGLMPRTTEIHVTFRTRDEDGILFHLPSNTDKFITMEIVRGRVQVLYNLGDGIANGDGDHILSLAHAPASNGQWHSVHMKRIGKWFQLKMDGGEGRYYNETWGPEAGKQMISVKLDQIVAGAHVVFKRNPIANGQDLNSTCINDIRLNDAWFPMESPEDEYSPAASLQYESNVGMRCIRDDCKDVRCPVGVPYSMECFPLWGMHDCRCPVGTYPDNFNCLPVDYCERDTPCFVGATCITKAYPHNFKCVCPPGWTGRLCNLLANTETAAAGLTLSFIVIIIISIFVILVVALLVFLLIRYKTRRDPEKYMLDPNDDDDIRENVVNYDEEGAGEEDQDAYDISRLRKPEDSKPLGKFMYDPITSERYPKRGAGGDRPDVGTFIHDRLGEADDDRGAPPHDSVREYVYEGGGSDTGSLSSLNTTSSVEEQDYDYLNDWGPKFSKLANLYGGDDEEEEEEYD